MENNKKQSFEEKLNSLETIVKLLENGDVSLDDAMTKFNEGMILANECNKILEEANKTITKSLNKDGKLEDFKIEK